MRRREFIAFLGGASAVAICSTGAATRQDAADRSADAIC